MDFWLPSWEKREQEADAELLSADGARTTKAPKGACWWAQDKYKVVVTSQKPVPSNEQRRLSAFVGPSNTNVGSQEKSTVQTLTAATGATQVAQS